jgi:hypothetical protein
MNTAALKSIPVGIVAERRKAVSQWIDFVWRPLAVLPGLPDAAPWTVLTTEGEATTFYVGTTQIELHRSETTNYRDNLSSGSPSVWVALRPTEDPDRPYTIAAATADPAEGEAFTEAGNDLIEAVPMPQIIRDIVAGFVAEHHVEREFFKRKRDRANPEALGRLAPPREDKNG